eukprot:4914894-Prymnesium_polylepis.1
MDFSVCGPPTSSEVWGGMEKETSRPAETRRAVACSGTGHTIVDSSYIVAPGGAQLSAVLRGGRRRTPRYRQTRGRRPTPRRRRMRRRRRTPSRRRKTRRRTVDGRRGVDGRGGVTPWHVQTRNK